MTKPTKTPLPEWTKNNKDARVHIAVDFIAISTQLEYILSLQLLEVFKKAEDACMKKLKKLERIPETNNIHDVIVQNIVDEATQAFQDVWRIEGFEVLADFIAESYTLGLIESALYNSLEESKDA